ncbi:hypothetical protein AB6A40_007371 [Gnathostoma spinigerum]|uniref:CSN8/PSMD8/EIF3K domain-containing protein n=1 Tax=Gnathostoma spinigerum TaxID=75299 RepID=A0ABD6EVR2_9BILA
MESNEEAAENSVVTNANNSYIPPSTSSLNSEILLSHPVIDEADFNDKLKKLERTEISIEQSSTVPSLYVQLAICYMIRQDFDKLRACRLRMQKLNIESLNSVIGICEDVEKYEFGSALKAMESAGFSESLGLIVNELRERIFLLSAKMLTEFFLSISSKEVAIAFNSQSNEELNQALRSLNWSVNEKGYVYPQLTDELKHFIDAKQNSPFGPLKSITAKEASLESENQSALDSIEKIVKLSAFTEISYQPKKEKTAPGKVCL